MCGIFAIFSKDGTTIEPKIYHNSIHTLREIAYRQSGKQRYRGPDDTGVKIIPEHGVAMVQERLAVIGVTTGHQPLLSDDGNIILIANGEIYNYLELAADIAKKRGHYMPKSDCNVIVELYEEYGEELLDYITGMYAFVLYDKRNRNILIARDPFGIIPLYIGEDIDGNIWVSSEMKCIVEFCIKLESFTPGELRFGKADNLKRHRYFNEKWMMEIPKMEVNLTLLRRKLEESVRSHLQCDVPFGALLSGGVDSSLVASIATKIKRERNENYKLKTFSVGLHGAPDFKAARLVAEYIDSDHTEVIFKIEDALDGIRDIIYHLETYDTTTIRCSLPMLILARYIKSTGIKMILSGEGADEIFGGYLYFFKAPNPIEFHKELVKRIEQLHHSDCLRANKVTMAKGLELRVPFLDTEFVSYIMSIRPEDKIPGDLNCFGGQQKFRIEKHILRAAFADDYLPNEILWRQKEQFSDGVGYDWIDTINRVVTERVTDDQFSMASSRFPINTPTTKEAFYYRSIFEEMFPGNECASTVKRWVPQIEWGCPEDPSGRVQAVHQAHQENITIIRD